LEKGKVKKKFTRRTVKSQERGKEGGLSQRTQSLKEAREIRKRTTKKHLYWLDT